jgi:hypothetical protein
MEMKIQEVRIGKRSGVNFNEHKLTVIIDTPEVLIHRFAKPDTGCRSITFINTRGILAITGDYGNWIFCREFHPSAEGFVSDSYWCEKLRIASTQKISDYSSEETKKTIEKKLKNIDEDLDEDDKEYLEDLLSQVDECEERFMVYAYDNLPKNRDCEFIPCVKKLNPWLEVIFDAFDEICLREKENLTPNHKER